MFSRLLAGTSAVAAMLALCFGNPASAAGGNEQGDGSASTVRCGVDTMAGLRPAIRFDSRYYLADMAWQDAGVRFSELRMFDDRPLPAVRTADNQGAEGYAVMDGQRWSSPQRQAGIYFMESIPGVGLHTVKCKDPKIDAGDSSASLQWDDLYGYRSFRMHMDEGSMTIEAYDPATGEPTDNWFLSLIAAREKSEDLPFTVIIPQRISATSGRNQYSVDIAQGTVALNQEDTPPAFSIYPDGGKIMLVFENKD